MSILLCLILEGMARLFYSDPYSPYPMLPSDYLPFTTPRNVDFHHHTPEFDVVYHFDEEGFRSSPAPETGTADRARLLVMGDSFTLGWGLDYDASFVGRLQARVREYQWLDAAYTAAYSPDAYYAYLVRNAARLRIQRCVVFVYDGNDLDDVHDNHWLQVDERGGPVQLVTRRRYIDYRGYPIPIDGRFDLLQVPVLRDSCLVRNVYHRMARPARSTSPSGQDMEPTWQRFEAAVKATSRFCAEQHIRLDYVVLPAPPVRRKDDWSERHQRMVDVLRRIPAPVLDLGERLSAEAYFPKDGHLNACGARIVAEAVADSIAPPQERLTLTDQASHSRLAGIRGE